MGRSQICQKTWWFLVNRTMTRWVCRKPNRTACSDTFESIDAAGPPHLGQRELIGDLPRFGKGLSSKSQYRFWKKRWRALSLIHQIRSSLDICLWYQSLMEWHIKEIHGSIYIANIARSKIIHKCLPTIRPSFVWLSSSFVRLNYGRSDFWWKSRFHTSIVRPA